jgi:phage shock protein PspC (stress-responsive transcriptional regulator)
MRVVTLDIVRAAIARMGASEEFGARREASPHDATVRGTTAQEPAKRRLYRSRSDRSIAGICGGIAEFFDLDPTLVRLLTLLLILFGGLSIWVYAILWIIVPDQPVRRNDIRTDTKR